jgi:hypothetical protein
MMLKIADFAKDKWKIKDVINAIDNVPLINMRSKIQGFDSETL